MRPFPSPHARGYVPFINAAAWSGTPYEPIVALEAQGDLIREVGGVCKGPCWSPSMLILLLMALDPPRSWARGPRTGGLDSYSGLLNNAALDCIGPARRQRGLGKPHDVSSMRSGSGIGCRDMRKGSINIVQVCPLHGQQQATCLLWCVYGRISIAQMPAVSSREPEECPGSSLLSLPAQSGSPCQAMCWLGCVFESNSANFLEK